MAITYSISGGADAAKFNIDPASGTLTFKVTPKFKPPGDANRDNIYDVIVKATVKATVVPKNPPKITSALVISVREKQKNVMTVTATAGT